MWLLAYWPPCCAASRCFASYLLLIESSENPFSFCWSQDEPSWLPQISWAHLGMPRAGISQSVGVAGTRWQTQANRKLLKWLGAPISVAAHLPALSTAAICHVSWCMCPDLVLTYAIHWSMVHLWYFSMLLTALFTLVSICSFLLFCIVLPTFL